MRVSVIEYNVMIDSLIECFFIIIDWFFGIVWLIFFEKGDEFILFLLFLNLLNFYLGIK